MTFSALVVRRTGGGEEDAECAVQVTQRVRTRRRRRRRYGVPLEPGGSSHTGVGPMWQVPGRVEATYVPYLERTGLDAPSTEMQYDRSASYTCSLCIRFLTCF